MNVTQPIRSGLAIALSLLPLFLFSQNLNQLWSHIDYGEAIGLHGMYVTDLNGDGENELLFSGQQYPGQHVFVTSYANGQLKNLWQSRFYDDLGVAKVLVFNADNDTDQEIGILLHDGTFEVYDGTTYALLQSIPTGVSFPYDAQIANIDADPAMELVTVSVVDLSVFDLGSLTMEYQDADYAGSQVLTGDVDGDGITEIVVSSPNDNKGYVLNGITKAVEWTYLGSFGNRMALADTNGDNVPEIFGASWSGSITIYDGLLHTPVDELVAIPNGVDAMWTGDTNQDGVDEVFVGDSQWGEIRVYNAETGVQIKTIDNPNHGVTRVCAGDADNDGDTDVVWGAGFSTSGADNLYIADLNLQLVQYTSQDLDGPFYLNAVDADADDDSEYFIASYGSNSGYDGAHILAFDVNTGDAIWSEPVNDRFARTTMGRGRSSTQWEIAGGFGLLNTLDAATHALLGQPDVGVVSDVVTADIDGDGRDEYIVGGSDGRVRILGFDNNGNLIPEWNSVIFGQIQTVRVFDVDDDPALEILFCTSESILYCFDGTTKALQWQIGDFYGARDMEVTDFDGDGALELLVARGNTLSVYDLATQALDITYDFSATGELWALEAVNLDGDAREELLVVDARLRIIDLETGLETWRSDVIQPNNVFGAVHLNVSDLFNDQFLDIFVGTMLGAYHFSSASSIPDVVPPRVRSTQPVADAQYQAIDVPVIATLNEIPNLLTVTSQTVKVRDAQGASIYVSFFFDSLLYQLRMDPLSGVWPSNDTITVWFSGAIADPSGNTLDGNNDGTGTGTPADDYSWTFTTGTGFDDLGPVALSTNLTPSIIWPGMSFKLAVLFSDLSAQATTGVAAAEYYLDQPGTPGSGTAFAPTDNAWGDVQENTFANISALGWTGGQRSIFVRGRDLVGNWGLPVEVIVTVNAESAASWPMFGQNAQHTNANTGSTLAPPLKLKWSKTFDDDYIALRPVTYANGYLLAPLQGYFSSAVQCLDTLNGDTVWTKEFVPNHSMNPVAYGYGQVYVQAGYNTNNSNVSCYNLLTGDLVWKSPFDAQWESYLGPTVAEGRVFINGGQYGGMYAYNAFNGVQQWFTPLPQFDQWTPAVFEGVAYAFAGGALSAHDVPTGAKLWEKFLPFDYFTYEMKTAPVIDVENRLIFTTSDYHLHAIDLDTREIEWTINSTFGISPALLDGVLYVIRDSMLEARNALTGSLLWKFNGVESLSYPPVLNNDYVFVASVDNVYAVHRATGQYAWNYHHGGYPTLGENMLLMADKTGTLRVFEMTTSAAATPDKPNLGFSVLPNPVETGGTVLLQYNLPSGEEVRLDISDASGRLISTLVQTQQPEGEQTAVWNTRDASAGVYFARLTVGGETVVRKVVVR
ncbi:MAG: PQQ-binding-like beta-propeller repeat protein [Saprospiraceae bacterium]|nr:PQQ-binding-like beta-propeller repeat protein [Saprospiraceae bacterium]